MFKKILALVAAVLVLAALAGCGGSGSSSTSASASSAATSATTTIETPKDLMSDSRIFQTMDEDWGAEYVIVYIGRDTGACTKLQDIVHLYKTAGYTIDNGKNFNPDSYFKGFSTFDFATMEVEEKNTIAHGDVIQLTFTFDNLKNNDNLRALDESGILILDKKDADFVFGDSVCDVAINNGGVEIDSSKRTELGLPFI